MGLGTGNTGFLRNICLQMGMLLGRGHLELELKDPNGH